MNHLKILLCLLYHPYINAAFHTFPNLTFPTSYQKKYNEMPLKLGTTTSMTEFVLHIGKLMEYFDTFPSVKVIHNHLCVHLPAKVFVTFWRCAPGTLDGWK